MKDKQEDFEEAKRGMDLENISKIINAHTEQLIEAQLYTFLCNITKIIDAYKERCTPQSTYTERQKYRKRHRHED